VVGLGIEASQAREIKSRLVEMLAPGRGVRPSRWPARSACAINVDGTRHILQFLADAPKLQRHQYISTA